MKLIKVLIVDVDRNLCLAIEKVLTQNFPQVEVVAHSHSVSSAITALLRYVPDVVVSDVFINEGLVFDVVEETYHLGYKLVLMSPYKNKYLDIVQFAAVDFLYKPIDETDLLLTFESVAFELSRVDYVVKLEALILNYKEPDVPKVLVLDSINGYLAVLLDGVVFGKADFSMTEFYLNEGVRIDVNQALRRYESMLGEYGFFRCHPLYVANIKFIVNINYEEKLLEMSTGAFIPFDERRLLNYYKKEENSRIDVLSET